MQAKGKKDSSCVFHEQKGDSGYLCQLNIAYVQPKHIVSAHILTHFCILHAYCLHISPCDVFIAHLIPV